MMMKTLASSYFVFRPCKLRVNQTLLMSSFPNHFTLINVSFNSPNYSSHSISISAKPQTTDEAEIHHTDTEHQKTKTVHVRFQLEKECAFGQQFLIVGDHPVIGLWDPSDGVPLVWSHGHLWTAQLDLPIGKVIKYKFVLQEEPETISWQLGPDRFLQTWDTEKTITVFEDWDDPQLQKIAESDLSEDIVVNSDLVVVDENLNPLTDEWTNDREQLNSDTDGSNIIGEKAAALLVAENIVERELALSNENINSMVDSDDETRLITDKGAPVLVPGLISIAREEIGQVLEGEHDESSTSNVPNSFVSKGEREHDKGTTIVPNVFVSEVEREHDKGINSDVHRVLASEVESEQNKSATSDVSSVLVSEVGNKLDKTTTSDVPSLLVSEVENEHDKGTTSDAPSVLVSEVENEHDKIATSDAPSVFKREVENEHEKCTKDAPILFVSEVGKGTTSNVPNDVDDLDVTELKEENVSASLDSTETNQDTSDKVQERKRVLDNVLKGNKQWGRQTLQKFLASLGFQSS